MDEGPQMKEAERFSLLDMDSCSLDVFIAEVEAFRDRNEGCDLKVEIESPWGEPGTCELVATRLETEGEQARRLVEDRRRKWRQELNERRTYEALKAKFERPG